MNYETLTCSLMEGKMASRLILLAAEVARKIAALGR